MGIAAGGERREAEGTDDGAARRGGPRRISVLGATGSIGASTLDLVSRHPDRF